MVSEVSERKDDPKDKTGVGEAWRFKVSALADPRGGIHEVINDCAYMMACYSDPPQAERNLVVGRFTGDPSLRSG